jgi:hypothetical protein
MFKPTHIYMGMVTARYGQPCEDLGKTEYVGLHKYRFEDGWTYTCNYRVLEKINVSPRVGSMVVYLVEKDGAFWPTTQLTAALKILGTKVVTITEGEGVEQKAPRCDCGRDDDCLVVRRGD